MDDKIGTEEFVKKFDILAKMDALLQVPSRRVQYEVVWSIIDAAMVSKHCDELVKLGAHRKIVEMISLTDLDLSDEASFFVFFLYPIV